MRQVQGWPQCFKRRLMPSAETFPSSLRAKGAALFTCSHWLNNFIIARTPRVRKGEFLVDQQKGLITPPLVQNTGQCSRLCLALIWSGSLVTYLFRIRSLRIFLGGRCFACCHLSGLSFSSQKRADARLNRRITSFETPPAKLKRLDDKQSKASWCAGKVLLD
jgi:hypothetical protein